MGDLQLLTNVATPDLYRSNPFRLLGLPVTADARKIRRTAERLQKRLKYGHEASFARAPLALNPSEDALSEATRRLDDPVNRLITEVFWLWPTDGTIAADDPAVSALAAGDVAGALAIWSEAADGAGDGITGLHNVAILSHALALDFEHEERAGRASADREKDTESMWPLALRSWQRLLVDEVFWSRLRDRVREIDDPQLTTEVIHQIREELPLALLRINGALALAAVRRGNHCICRRHVDLLKASPFDAEIVEQALRNASQPLRQRLSAAITHAKAEAESSGPKSSAEHARALLEGARPVLDILDRLLPEESALRGEAHDRVAETVGNMAIEFGNSTNCWGEVLALLNDIELLAVGLSLRQWILDNREITADNVRQDLCWFCEENQPSEEHAIKIDMHGDITHSENYVNWRHMTVIIKRCGACVNAHNAANNENKRMNKIRSIAFSLIFLPGIIISAFISTSFFDFITNHAPPMIDLTAYPGKLFAYSLSLVLFMLPLIYIYIMIRKHEKRVNYSILQNRRPEAARLEYPLVKELLSEGWAFGSRPAGVTVDSRPAGVIATSEPSLARTKTSGSYDREWRGRRESIPVFIDSGSFDSLFDAALHHREGGNIKVALDLLLSIMEQNPAWNDGAARDLFMEILMDMIPADPLRRSYREKLKAVIGS